MRPKKSATSRKNSLEQSWTPFYRCDPDENIDGEIFKNSRYQIVKRLYKATKDETAPDMIHLSLKRLDGGTYIPFRDLMRMKRELLDPEIELIEIYPAESRLIDTANQFHFWGLDDRGFRFPFGFTQGRLVGEGSGVTQTPYEEGDQPSDWLPSDQIAQRITELDQKGQ